jgi:hypothetical protein
MLAPLTEQVVANHPSLQTSDRSYIPITSIYRLPSTDYNMIGKTCEILMTLVALPVNLSLDQMVPTDTKQMWSRFINQKLHNLYLSRNGKFMNISTASLPIQPKYITFRKRH